MFDIDKFYYDAEQGEQADVDGFRDYLNSFERVIIWGAGNLGTALGKGLIERDYGVDCYWDKDFLNIHERNGLRVYEPFTGDQEPKTTLVIIGIVNGTLSHTWQKYVLEEKGYHNYVLGMRVYEAIVCSQSLSKPFDVKECVHTSICNFNTCHRYMNIIGEGRHKTGLSVHVLEIIVSSRCTLDCKYCGQQAGDTKRRFPEKYLDYDVDEIKKSIDLVMDRLDIVGTFSIIGGEPFIHPGIAEILRHCLSKENVGIISITTNGVFKLDEELLDVLGDDRIKVNFSNYTAFLDDRKKEIFEKNVRIIKDKGISCNVGTPIWNKVIDDLKDNPIFEDEYLDKRKEICVFGPSIAGKYLYACPNTERYSRMEIHDVSDEVIDLFADEDKLEDKLRELLEKGHYVACRYMCANGKEAPIIPAGEQYR